MINLKFFAVVVCAAVAALVLPMAPSDAQTLRFTPSLPSAGIRTGDTAAQRSADFIVAVVNSEPITNNEVRARVVRFEQQQSQRGGTMPPRAELMQQVLERLISERAQVQVARDNGIKIDEPALNTAVQNVARQNQITVDELRKRLEADGISYSQFRSGIQDEMLLGRVREREVERRMNITEGELDQFIAELQGNPTGGDVEINLAQILIAVPESASPEQVQVLQARANTAAERARAGEDFAALARRLSQAPDSANGGQMGLRPADRYPGLFVEATQATPVGGIAGPVRSGAGFHILKVVDKKQQSALPVSVAQTRARHILLRVNAQLSETAARTRLVELRRRILAREISFEAAAKQFSQDGSAPEGGDLGWANAGQFVPEFEEVMNSLEPNALSEPVVTRFGVHLIAVQERRQADISPKEQRELARTSLREKKSEEAFVVWAQEVRGRAYVELRDPPQ
jgi:peptidyl-prolyl cis-trans isomerase SurA